MHHPAEKQTSELEMWLCWERACLTRRKLWVQPPTPHKSDMEAQTCTQHWDQELGDESEVWSHSSLHSEFKASLKHETLFQEKKKREKKRK